MPPSVPASDGALLLLILLVLRVLVDRAQRLDLVPIDVFADLAGGNATLTSCMIDFELRRRETARSCVSSGTASGIWPERCTSRMRISVDEYMSYRTGLC